MAAPLAVLPAPPTPLIGRDRELAAILALIASGARLVTLTGAPGIGKSRLALEVAGRLAASMQGAAVVDLVPVTDPSRFGSAVADSLGVREAPGSLPMARVIEVLRDVPLLLVLDNFEHLLGAAPQVGDLLSVCPGLRIIVTSRAPLHLAWEHEFPLPPLEVPEASTPLAVEILTACPAVELFLERARAVSPDFALTRSNADTVAEICRRLEGLPLAIELAAPRIKILWPEALLERLQHRLDFLGRVGRHPPVRHQTLRAAIGWSYTLLDPPEQALFRRLSVFVGGFSLGAAESVCWSTQEPRPFLDALEALTDASLLSRGPVADEPRFRMLETIREFAAEQLAATGELPRTRRHHAAYFVALAETTEPRLRGPQEVRWVRTLESDADNCRTALAWLLSEDQGRAALRLSTALWWFWYTSGRLGEGTGWLETSLRAATDPGPEMIARALYGLGVLAWRQGEFAGAVDYGSRSLQLFRQTGDRWGTATSLFLLEMVARSRGDLAGATSLVEESLTMFREVGDAWGVATALLELGSILCLRGEYPEAAARHAESLRLFQSIGDSSGVAASIYSLGVVAREQGDVARAAILAEEALALARSLDDPSREAFALHLAGLVARDRGEYERSADLLESSRAVFDRVGDAWGVAYSLSSLATVARLRGDLGRAWDLEQQSLKLRARHGDRWGIAECVAGLARLAAGHGDAERAVRWLGAADALREALGTPVPLREQEEHARTMAALRSAIGKRRFEQAWHLGRALAAETLLDEILTAALPDRADRAAPIASRIGPLTPREVEVANLIAKGMTNQQIASALYITPGTVATHVQHILTKLGFQSRAQIAAWTSAHARGPGHPA